MEEVGAATWFVFHFFFGGRRISVALLRIYDGHSYGRKKYQREREREREITIRPRVLSMGADERPRNEEYEQN